MKKLATLGFLCLAFLAGCGTGPVSSAGGRNPVPSIASLAPTSAVTGGASFTLTVYGDNFTSSSVVNFGGTPETTIFISAAQLTASIPAAAIATAGMASVTVTNPGSTGSMSSPMNFSITSQNPLPTITSITPTVAASGGAGFTLTVTGTNFISTSVVNFNGTPESTNFTSASQVIATIPASAIATSGTADVTVVNPAPGGGTSNSVSLNIGKPNPIPTITSITPSTGFVGESAFTLMVTGTNFLPTSLITFGGNARTTTFISSTQLSAVIDANSLAAAGSVLVYVSNPAPSGGTSNSANFDIVTPPSISSIAPTSAATAGAAFTLTVYGYNFLPTSTLNFGGTPEPTTIISTSELTASIPASAIAKTGTASVTVTSPGPDGGASNAVNFTVSPGGGIHPTPVIGTLTPTGVSAGGPGFTLTINDSTSSYVNGSVVQWNGADRPTTFVAANEITAQISASDYSTPGTAFVSVFNPAPGGGLSRAAPFTIVAGGLGPVSVTVVPDPTHKLGKFVYVANQSSDNISIFTADATTGLLTFVGTVATDAGPSSVTTDPSGKFLYATNSNSGTISMYAIDGTTGHPTSIGTLAAGTAPTFIAIHPSGKFAYATNLNSNNISMYTVDATTGHLTSMGAASTAGGPKAIAVDPTGKFAYVAGDYGAIDTFTVETTTGALTSGGLIYSEFHNSAVTVDPSGHFVYVVDSGDCDALFGGIWTYAINAAFNGELSFSGTIGAGFCSIGIAVDPSGKFAYVTNSGDNNISMFGINSSTGLLSSIGLVAAGTSPWSIAIDPSGRFVYVTNFQSNDISIYSIDPATGFLTLIGTISS